MGNPLEITETDKAWLAGAIEGDGAISLGFQAYQGSDKRRFAVKPIISFANQDALLVEEVVRIMSAVSGKNPHLREVPGHFQNSQSSMTVALHGMYSVKAVIEAILPYLRGEKQARARLLHRFLQSRASRHQGRGDSASKTPYNEEELLLIKTLYENGRRKGGKRNPEIGEILRDYTRDVALRAAKI